MCYTDTKSDNEPRKKKNLTSTAKNHGGGVDGLNRANEGWQRQLRDKDNTETEEDEEALQRKKYGLGKGDEREGVFKI